MTAHKRQVNPYDMALKCQDACNSSGIIYDLARAMDTICDETRGSTAARNRHPALILILDKLVDLAGGSVRWDLMGYHEAYNRCQAELQKTAESDQREKQPA